MNEDEVFRRMDSEERVYDGAGKLIEVITRDADGTLTYWPERES